MNTIANTFYEQTKKNIVVTSGTRTAEKQAKAIFDKLRLDTKALDIYKNQVAAQQIKKAYDDGLRLSNTKIISNISDVIRKQMENKVYMSRHLISGAVDIRSRDFTKKQQNTFVSIVNKIPGAKILNEGKPPHFHIGFTKKP